MPSIYPQCSKLHSVHVSIKSYHLSVRYNKKSYLHNRLVINSILFNVKENWNPRVWISLCWQPPFDCGLSLRSKGHARGVPSGTKWQSIWIEENEITKHLVYSVVLRLSIVLWSWKLSMRSVLFNFNFELMLLFTEYFKIVLERFRSSLLHYRYMDGILTVVRACPETQLDYSN
jgi:hypothetical protein